MLESLAWEKLRRETSLGFAKGGDLGHMGGNWQNYPMTSLLDSVRTKLNSKEWTAKQKDQYLVA